MNVSLPNSLSGRSIAIVSVMAVALLGFLVSALPAIAHDDPVACFSTGLGVSITVYRADGFTPVGGGSATPGETLKYQTTLSHAGGSNCNYELGTLTITKPDGGIVDVTGGGISLVTTISSFTSSQVSYVVSSADAVGDNDLDVSTNYTGGTSHTPSAHSTVSGSATAQTPFVKLTPTIATTPSAGGVIGVTLNDTATLSGGFSPTGSVTFTLYPPSDPTCSGAASYTDADASFPYATSPGFVSNAVGVWHWKAAYAGDANNNPVTSPCADEAVTVTKASPTISTTPSAGGPIGTVLNDTATLSGGSSPTGNVTFNLFDPSDATCVGLGVDTDVDPLAPYATSPGYTSLVAGIYRWTADYAGDANNNAVSSGCQDEQVVVDKLTPQIATNIHNNGDHVTDIQGTTVPAGTSVHDKATVSGTVAGGTPTGTVDFKRYSTIDCTGSSVDENDVALVGGSAESSAFVTVAGFLSYKVHYDGDANYNAADDDACEPLTVVEPLLIKKTAETSYDRAWDWTIEKTAATSTLLLAEGQSYTVDYDVTVNATSTDINHVVSGTITITNPVTNPPVLITSVTDVLNISGATVVVCLPGLPILLPPGGVLVCTYSLPVLGKADTENTVTVATEGTVPGGVASATVAWGAPANEIDECINVSDTNGTDGILPNTICANEPLPHTYEYGLTFGPAGGQGVEVPVACGENDHRNVVSFVTTDDNNDTDESGQDDWNVHVTVECEIGCTLTQGYWKTHNDSFWGGAPTDDNWDNITPLAELSGFFTTVSSYPVVGPNLISTPFTWFSVFWTAPKGNAYYNLAHQYMAAKLNILNGASTIPAVDAAIIAAEDFFDSYTPATFSALGKKDPLRASVISWAGTLGSYNEGLIGPGHCDEQIPI